MQIPVGTITPSPVTVALNAQESSPITTEGASLVGFFTDTTMTSTTVTFEAATAVGGTYVAVKDKTGAAISYTIAASGYYAVDPVNFQGILFLKMKFGTAEGAARAITAMMKGI